MTKWAAWLTLTALCLATAPTALAAPVTTNTYDLTSDLCSGGSCGAGPFGTVTVSSVSADEVAVTLTLAKGEIFANTGAGDSLLFDLSGNPGIKISAISPTNPTFTAIQTASGGSIKAGGGAGTWQYAVDCTGCGNGTSSPTSAGPLSFDITDMSGITPGSFVVNDKNYYFAADIMGTTGKTGVVAAPALTTTTISSGGTTSSVPEPATLAVLGMGLLALGQVRRRRA